VATASSVIILAKLQQILDMNHDAAHDLDSGITLQKDRTNKSRN
jgi:hypothetical protein